jgi:hypothetical protein
VREHTDLAAVVGLVSQHVAEHFEAGGPGLSPAVADECLDASFVARHFAERFRQHFGAASGAFGQRIPSLLRREVRTAELSRNLQVRSRQPDPLAADVVHVGEDGRNAADFARRFGRPEFGGKVLDENLVYPIISGKDLDRGSSEGSLRRRWMSIRSTNFGLTLGHGLGFLEEIIRPRRQSA